MANTTVAILLKRWDKQARRGQVPPLDTMVELPVSMGTPEGRAISYRAAFEEYCSPETRRSVEGQESSKAMQTYLRRASRITDILSTK